MARIEAHTPGMMTDVFSTALHRPHLDNATCRDIPELFELPSSDSPRRDYAERLAFAVV